MRVDGGGCGGEVGEERGGGKSVEERQDRKQGRSDGRREGGRECGGESGGLEEQCGEGGRRDGVGGAGIWEVGMDRGGGVREVRV